MKRLALLLIVLPPLLVVRAPPAGAQETPSCPFAGQTPQLVVQLFFGQSIKGAGLISRRAWTRFVADTITPSLPGGFTITDAYGQWQDPATHAIGREPTELLVVAAKDSPDFRARIAGIADAFRRRFDLREVGIVSAAGCGAF